MRTTTTYAAWVVSLLVLALLSGYGCTCRYRVDPVRYRHLSESHWPPPRDELPKQFRDLHHAFQREYLRYGEVEVVGSKETALREAAKLGAEVVVLEAKSFQVGVGDGIANGDRRGVLDILPNA